MVNQRRAIDHSRIGVTLFLFSVAPYVLLYGLWRTALLFLPDDAYYYFQIARNIADGFGSTFDRINLTNGYHPLWCLLLSAVARIVTSPDGLVRSALLLQVGLVWLGWTVVFRSLYRKPSQAEAIGAGAVSLLLTWNFYVSKILINGLESALAFAAGAIFVHAFAVAAEESPRISASRATRLGVLVSLLILSRLDCVFYVPVVLVIWGVRERRDLGRHVRAMTVFAAIPVVTIAVYALVNQRVFGLWLPVSGYVKRVVRAEGPSLVSIAAGAAVLAMIVLATRFALGRGPDLRSRRDVTVITLAAFVALFQIDALVLRGLLIPPELWYFPQHLLWIFAVAALTVCRLVEMPAKRGRRLLMAAAVTAVLAIALSWTIRLQRTSYDAYVAARELADWTNVNLPDTTILAGWDVGIIGYYSHARVINLDGLVNGAELARALQRNDGVAFLDRSGAEYITQHYVGGVERFQKLGYDPIALRRRLGDVVFSRTAHFASIDYALRTGRASTRAYEYQVRRYRK